MGWAASIVLLIGIGYQYSELNETNNQVVTIEKKNQNCRKL